MQSDWSLSVRYWPCCTLDLNIVLFSKKATFEISGVRIQKFINQN